MNAKIIAIANQKGGVGKTTTAVSLSVGLARLGKKVLITDLDPQGSMTISLGYHQPDELQTTIFDIMTQMIERKLTLKPEDYILTKEGVDFIPSNTQLSCIEFSLVNTMNRENKLKMFLNTLRDRYDYIIIDCAPSLGMLTVNALVAADSVIIPVQASFLATKGLEALLGSISNVKMEINPELQIEGILITMFDKRTNFAKDVADFISKNYGNYIKIFKSFIPVSIKAGETTATGKSIFTYDCSCKVAESYGSLAQEVLNDGRE